MVCWQELEQQPWAQRFKLCLEVVSVSTLGPPTSELGEREINLILFDLVAAWIVPRLVSLWSSPLVKETKEVITKKVSQVLK